MNPGGGVQVLKLTGATGVPTGTLVSGLPSVDPTGILNPGKLGLPDRFAHRIARNSQLLLLEDLGAGLLQAALDPAGVLMSDHLPLLNVLSGGAPNATVNILQPYATLGERVEDTFLIDGASLAHSLEEALSLAVRQDPVFVIGGGEIYDQTVALADALGIRSDARHGGESDGILYLLFPGSGNLRPRTIGEIQSSVVAIRKNFFFPEKSEIAPSTRTPLCAAISIASARPCSASRSGSAASSRTST